MRGTANTRQEVQMSRQQMVSEKQRTRQKHQIDDICTDNPEEYVGDNTEQVGEYGAGHLREDHRGTRQRALSNLRICGLCYICVAVTVTLHLSCS